MLVIDDVRNYILFLEYVGEILKCDTFYSTLGIIVRAMYTIFYRAIWLQKMLNTMVCCSENFFTKLHNLLRFTVHFVNLAIRALS